MSVSLPAFFPNLKRSDVRIVPVTSRTSWMAMLQQRPGALSQQQNEQLLTMGFVRGENGRLFYPQPMPRLQMEQLCRVLGGEIEVLEADQAVELRGGAAFESQIPIPVRQGIGWWFNNDRQALAREIRYSLAENPDEAAQDILNRYTDGQWRNPDRLKQWVADALDGEINPVTEPILGLGVAYALSQKPVDDPDPEVEALRHRLAEFRGEQPNEAPRPALAGDSVRPVQGHYPAIGDPVSWRNEAGAIENGRVKRLSDSDPDRVWVIPNRAHYVAGLTLPQTVAVNVDDLLGPYASASVSEGEHEQAPINDRSETNPALRTTIEIGDIPAESFHHMASQEYPPKRTRILLDIMAKTRGMNGTHPLAPEVPARLAGNEESAMVSRWGALRETLGVTLGDETPAAEDARLYLRDRLIEQFNEAQPETLAGEGEYPELAVIPFNVAKSPGSGVVLDSIATDDALERVNQHELYSIGIHPRMAWANETLAQALDTFSANAGHISEIPRKTTIDMAKDRFGGTDAHLGLNGLIPANASINPMLLRNAVDEFDPDSGEPFEQVSFRRGNGVVYKDPNRAAEDLEALYRGELPPMYNTIRERNERVLGAIAQVAGQSRDELRTVADPTLQTAMGLASRVTGIGGDPATALAMVGLDLEQSPELAGEIAMSAGIVPLESQIATYAGEPYESVGGRGRVHDVQGYVSTLGLSIEGKGARWASVAIYIDREQSTLPVHQTAVGNGPHHGPKLFTTGKDDVDILPNLGRLMALKAHTDFELSPTGQVQTLTPTDLESVPVTWVKTPNFLLWEGMSMGASPGSQVYQRIGEGAGSQLDAEDQEAVTGMYEALDRSQQRAVHSTDMQRRNMGNRDMVKEAIKMWAGSQPMRNFSDGALDQITNSTLSALQEGAEIALVAHRATRARYYWNVHPITMREIEAAGFDRKLAVEKTIAWWKRTHRAGERFNMAVFDAMSALRPETLKALDALKNDSAEQAGDTPDSQDAQKEGRQNTGLVHGLSMKDLRGKREDVLATLDNASADNRKKFITKTRLWEAPDWVAMRSPEDGTTPMEPVVAEFWNQLRKQAPATSPADTPKANELFSRAMLLMRDHFGEYRTAEQLREAINDGGVLSDEFNAIVRDSENTEVSWYQILGSKMGRNRDAAEAFNMIYLDSWNQTMGNRNWPRVGGGRRAASQGQGQGEKTGAMPALEKLKRTGPDHRNGRDIEEHELIETFGFSGIEYGESMPQRERTIYLNEAYDAFMDMAHALGVQPATLSMGGTLGLAFGSRGRGGRNAALAHFEPSNNVINLTRMKGAGSLAHEFGHTLSNYFSRMVTGQRRGPGDLAEMVASQRPMGFLNSDRLGELRKVVYDGFSTIMANAVYTPVDDERPQNEEDAVALGRFERVPLVGQPISPRKREQYMSSFYKDAVEADHKERRRKPEKYYWANPKELFARAFETWVNHKLVSQDPNFRNDYLVRPDKLMAWGKSQSQQAEVESSKRRVQLYPGGDTLQRLDYSFRQLFNSLETGHSEIEHEYLGKTTLPYLYSHDHSVERSQPGDRSAFAQCAIDEIVRMCGREVELRWQRELMDDLGSLVPGRFSVIEGRPERGEPGLRGLIELSMSAPVSTVHHEAFHYAQHFLITDDERQMLDDAFAIDGDLHQRVMKALADDGKPDVAQYCDNPSETQAYAFEQWAKGNLDLSDHQPPLSKFRQIQWFMEAAAGITRDYGFETPEALFRNFYDGRLALRQELACPGSLADPALTHAAELERKHHYQAEPGGNSNWGREHDPLEEAPAHDNDGADSQEEIRRDAAMDGELESSNAFRLGM